MTTGRDFFCKIGSGKSFTSFYFVLVFLIKFFCIIFFVFLFVFFFLVFVKERCYTVQNQILLNQITQLTNIEELKTICKFIHLSFVTFHSFRNQQKMKNIRNNKTFFLLTPTSKYRLFPVRKWVKLFIPGQSEKSVYEISAVA